MMIYESHFWKDDLLKQARNLSARKVQSRWPEASFGRVEQTVMNGFYAIRKLIEAHKIADALTHRRIPVETFPWLFKPVTYRNWHHYWELYDLSVRKPETRELIFLAHLVIHSYVFLIEFDEANRFVGILVTSDRHRHKCLYSLRIDSLVEIFEAVGTDYPNEYKATFNPARSDFDVSVSTHMGGDWSS
jgi:hypothetical protein